MKSLSWSIRAACTVLGIAAGVSACAVGPKYNGPPAVAHEDRFVRSGEAVQSAVRPAGSWWESLADVELERLIKLALADSPDLDAAEARLRKARSVARQQRAAQLPKVSADVLALRSNASLSSSGSPGSGSPSSSSSGGLEFYNVGFDASWELDLFGGSRSARRAAGAQAEASRAELEDLHVSLAAEVGRVYVGLRGQQQRLELLRRSADMEREILGLTEQRRSRGVASEFDVERSRAQFESTQAMMIPLQQGIQESLDGLAVLTGRAPGTLDDELTQAQPLPQLPGTVNVDDPADILRRRPDIRAAERRLAARTAIVGQRTADLFPKVSLLGSVGFGGNSTSGLFNDDNLIWLVAPVLRWSFLDFGGNKARVDQAQADRDEAIASYKSTVLNALQDAETSLSRFGNRRRSVVTLQRVKSSADRAAELAQQRRKAGALSQIDFLDAERTRVNAEQDLAQSQAELVQSFIALQKSLGLGWDSGS
jgi:NodT family efflux transporter outer membrane factor (OMF) lipoprotein